MTIIMRMMRATKRHRAARDAQQQMLASSENGASRNVGESHCVDRSYSSRLQPNVIDGKGDDLVRKTEAEIERERGRNRKTHRRRERVSWRATSREGPSETTTEQDKTSGRN